MSDRSEIQAYAAECLSPFVRDDHPSAYERIRTKLMFPLIPFRFLAAILIGTIPWNLLCQLHVLYSKVFRKGVVSTLQYKLIGVYCRIFSRVFLFMCGFRTRVHGKWSPNIDGRPVTIVCNHCSYWDTFPFVTQGKMSYVAKAGLDKVPIFGMAMRLNKMVLVDRANGQSRDDAKRLIRERMELKDAFSPLIVFPEGTTTNGRYLIPFKTSAFEPGLPVQPVYLKYNMRFFKPFWTTLPAGEHIKRSLGHFFSTIDMHVMPPYIPSDEEKADPALYAENVRKAMSEASGMPLRHQLTRWKFAYQKALRGEMTLDELKELVEKKEE